MAVRGRDKFLHSVLWAGAGLLVALAGLLTSLHESGTHDTCVRLAHGIREGIGQTGLNCGFTDTVYWAGIVILAAGALSAVATGGAAISTATKSRRASGRSEVRLEGWKGFEQPVDPMDPATRRRLDPASTLAEDMMPTSHPPPAWYTDPEQNEAIRWWDGQSWGESRLNPQR